MNDKHVKSNDILSNIFNESQVYQSLENIEKLVISGQSLENIPHEPLYMAVKNLPAEQVGYYLDKFSPEQRQTFLDLDLWSKDELDIEAFQYWLEAYHRCPHDEIVQDFVKDETFLLFLKGRFNIWTFDAEDPMYPDHDNYFLTDDGLLLFEFSDETAEWETVRELIRKLYHDKGVENAYSHLFKVISDSPTSIQEDIYREKKERLRDIGMVDYYDSLEFENIFPNLEFLEHFLKKKTKVTGNISNFSRNQTLPYGSIVAYKDHVADLQDELSKITEQKRIDYLHFNFVRLINATLSFHNCLKEGTVAMTRVGSKTRTLLNLGLHYVSSFMKKNDMKFDSVFEVFEFNDLYKVGHSLIRLKAKEVKIVLHKFELDKEDGMNFVGQFWNEFVDNTFEDVPRYSSSQVEVARPIETMDLFNHWSITVDGLVAMSPFIATLFQTFQKMKLSGSINDDYYLNYSVNDLDFEAIIISNLINFDLGLLGNNAAPKLGITIDELKVFTSKYFDEEGSLDFNAKLKELLTRFLLSFGMGQGDFNLNYMKTILEGSLNGYDFQNLNWEDYKHIGGPILLKRINS